MKDVPFIPVWLDEAGLSPGAFRVYCNLWRRKNRTTGQCNPSGETIAATCGWNKSDTVWPYIAELEERGFLERKKKFAGENQYTLIIPITPQNGVIGESLSPQKTGEVLPRNSGELSPRETGQQSTPLKYSIEIKHPPRDAAEVCVQGQDVPEKPFRANYNDLAEALRLVDGVPFNAVTTSYWKKLHRIGHALRKKTPTDLTPDEVRRRAEKYHEVMPNGCKLTADALLKHWERCAVNAKPKAATIDGPPGWRETLAKEYPDNAVVKEGRPWSAVPEIIRQQLFSGWSFDSKLGKWRAEKGLKLV